MSTLRGARRSTSSSATRPPARDGARDEARRGEARMRCCVGRALSTALCSCRALPPTAPLLVGCGCGFCWSGGARLTPVGVAPLGTGGADETALRLRQTSAIGRAEATMMSLPFANGKLCTSFPFTSTMTSPTAMCGAERRAAPSSSTFRIKIPPVSVGRGPIVRPSGTDCGSLTVTAYKWMSSSPAPLPPRLPLARLLRGDVCSAAGRPARTFARFGVAVEPDFRTRFTIVFQRLSRTYSGVSRTRSTDRKKKKK